MKYKAYKRLVVKHTESPKFSAGGIALPDNQNKPNHERGVIVSGYLYHDGRDEMIAEEGDTILFNRVGTPNENGFYFVDEASVLAILAEDDKVG